MKKQQFVKNTKDKQATGADETKRAPFVMVPKELITSGLSNSDFRLYCGLNLYSLPSFPSWNRIRKDIHLSFATISKAQKKLVKANVVAIEHGNCRKKANRYTMLDREFWRLPEKPKRSKKRSALVSDKSTLEIEVTTTLETETRPLQIPEPNKNNGSETNDNESNEQQQELVIDEISFSWLTEILRQSKPKTLLAKSLIRRWFGNGNFDVESPDIAQIITGHFNSSDKAKNYGKLLISEVNVVKAMFYGLHEVHPKVMNLITLEFMENSYSKMASDPKEDEKILSAFGRSEYGLLPEEIVYVRMKAHVHYASERYLWAFDGQSRYLGIPIKPKPRKLTFKPSLNG